MHREEEQNGREENKLYKANDPFERDIKIRKTMCGIGGLLQFHYVVILEKKYHTNIRQT